MKKLVYISGITLGFAATAQAQISSLNPVAGTALEYEDLGLQLADSGAVGDNQVWDFTGAGPGNIYSTAYRLMTAAEQLAYPQANLAVVGEDSEIDFISATADSLVWYGSTEHLLYTDPSVMYFYPITTPGYSFTDHHVGSYYSGNTLVQVDGHATLQLQGSGTLILNEGAHDFVYKLKTSRVVDYIVNEAVYEQVIIERYQWVNENEGLLLEIESRHFVNGTNPDEVRTRALVGKYDVAGLSEVVTDNFSAYPNPSATGQVTIAFRENQGALKTVLTSASGQVIETRAFNGLQELQYELPASGAYFLTITTAAGTVQILKLVRL
jgi:hypothetical protein